MFRPLGGRSLNGVTAQGGISHRPPVAGYPVAAFAKRPDQQPILSSSAPGRPHDDASMSLQQDDRISHLYSQSCSSLDCSVGPGHCTIGVVPTYGQSSSCGFSRIAEPVSACTAQTAGVPEGKGALESHRLGERKRPAGSGRLQATAGDDPIRVRRAVKLVEGVRERRVDTSKDGEMESDRVWIPANGGADSPFLHGARRPGPSGPEHRASLG